MHAKLVRTDDDDDLELLDREHRITSDDVGLLFVQSSSISCALLCPFIGRENMRQSNHERSADKQKREQIESLIFSLQLSYLAKLLVSSAKHDLR
jgi:hypothetical protein